MRSFFCLACFSSSILCSHWYCSLRRWISSPSFLFSIASCSLTSKFSLILKKRNHTLMICSTFKAGFLCLICDLPMFQVLCDSMSLELFLKCFLLLLSQGFVLFGLHHISDVFVHIFIGILDSLLQLNLSIPLLQHLCQQERTLWKKQQST